MKQLFPLLIIVSFFALNSLQAAQSTPIEELKTKAEWSTKSKSKAERKKQIKEFKKARKQIKERKKSTTFAMISTGFSLLALIASLTLPTSALWAIVFIAGGSLLLAILFISLAIVFRLREMKAEGLRS